MKYLKNEIFKKLYKKIDLVEYEDRMREIFDLSKYPLLTSKMNAKYESSDLSKRTICEAIYMKDCQKSCKIYLTAK